MPLETASYIADLVATNPVSSDNVGQGDDHLRMIKSTLQTTFPNLGNRYSRVILATAGYTVLSSDNTAMIVVPTPSGATLTHTFSLPALSSITAGFYIDFQSSEPTGVSDFIATGGASIESSAFVRLGPAVGARVMYDGTTWRVSQYPIALVGGSRNFKLPQNLEVTGNLTVSGAAQLNSTLSVSGAAVINGAVFINNTLSVTGAAGFGGTVSVSGAAHFTTTVSVGGAATLASTLSVSGAAALLGGFVVPAGNGSIGGGLTVSGTLTISGAAEFTTSLNAHGAFSVSGVATFGGFLVAEGGVLARGTMSVSGAANFVGTVTIGGAATLASTLSVSGAAHFKTTLSVGGATTLASTLHVDGTTSFSSTVVMDALLDLQVGQIKFPASQNASADANTLDDYEEGTWTPTLTCVTPGNLTVAYTTRNGFYTKVGRLVSLTFEIETSTFTHTTAAGNLQITGVPFASLTSQPGQIGYSSGLTAVTSGAYMAILAASTISLYNVQPTTAATAQLSVTTNTTSGVQVRVISNIVHEV